MRVPPSCIATILSTNLCAGSNSAAHDTPTRSFRWRSIQAILSAKGIAFGLSSAVLSILEFMSETAYVRPSKYYLLHDTIS